MGWVSSIYNRQCMHKNFIIIIISTKKLNLNLVWESNFNYLE